MSQITKSIFLLLLMVVTAALGVVLRPTNSVADTLTPINLKEMVPGKFKDWTEDSNTNGQVIDPSQQQQLGKIYSETLSRVYVNSAGYRIMLSIAYGKNQSGNLQLHRPEVCYPSQGFQILSVEPTQLHFEGLQIPALRINAKLGERIEPLIYWTVVGDQVATSMVRKRLIEVRYAMRRLIPDGMLVRISSIDRDSTAAASNQEQFASDLIESIRPVYRSRFAGKPAAIE